MIRTALSIIARLVAAAIIVAVAVAGVLFTAGAASLADVRRPFALPAFSWLSNPELGFAYFVLGCLGALLAVALLAFVPSFGNRLEQMRVQADLDELREEQELVVQMRLAMAAGRTELSRDQMRLVVGLNMLGDDIDRLTSDLRNRVAAERRWLFALSLPIVLMGGAVALVFTGFTVADRYLTLGGLLFQSACWGILWVGLISVIDVVRTTLHKAAVAPTVPNRQLVERVADMDVRFRSDLQAIQQGVTEGRQSTEAQLADISDRVARLEEAVTRLQPPVGDLTDLSGLTLDHARLLRQAGVNTKADLLQRAGNTEGRRTLESQTGIAHSQLLRWVNRAELMQIDGINAEVVELLREAGIESLRELAQRNPAYLQARLVEVGGRDHRPTPIPSLKQVTAWIEAAKRQAPVANRERPRPSPILAPQG